VLTLIKTIAGTTTAVLGMYSLYSTNLLGILITAAATAYILADLER